MSKQQDERTENLRVLLEQHWHECKHIESERAWFMNAYAVVVGGALAFIIGMKAGEIKEVETSPLFTVLIVFLVVFTFFGFFHTLRWTYAFECHRKRVNEFARILWLESGVKVPLDPTMVIPAMHIVPAFIWKLRIPRCIRDPINEFFRTRFWFPLLYFGILIGLAILFFKVDGFPSWSKWVAIAFSALALLLGIRWWFSLKGIEKERRIVLEGCNGEWAQEWYFPFLLRKAANEAIELWAVDIEPEIKLSSPNSVTLWHMAQSKGKACYLDKTRDKKTYEKLSNIDYVFVVTPDQYHCKITEFWLERLSEKGKIFIEKPLDTSKRRARALGRKIDKNNIIVYGFDHYLARAYPFLQKKASHLRQIGKISNIEFHFLESSQIRLEQKGTANKGVIFVLFPHVLALVCAIVEQNSSCSSITLQTVELKSVKATQYYGCPIAGETFAQIKFTANNIEVDSIVGKCIGNQEDKWLSLHGTNGSIKLDFVKDESILDLQRSQRKQGKLNPKHVESFLERVLSENRNPLLTPGVIDFDAALEILTILDKAERQISKMPKYRCKETVSEILERFKN